MNVSSWMVLKSNHSYQRIGYWKPWCGNGTVTRKSSTGLRLGGLYICAVGLDILNFEQTSLFYSAYLNSGGLELCFGGAKSPSKTSHGYGTVWQNFSFLLNATDSEKYLVTRYVKLARYVKLSVYEHDRAQSGTTHSGSVYSASWGNTCAGTILPSFEHNWLKWSCARV